MNDLEELASRRDSNSAATQATSSSHGSGGSRWQGSSLFHYVEYDQVRSAGRAQRKKKVAIPPSPAAANHKPDSAEESSEALSTTEKSTRRTSATKVRFAKTHGPSPGAVHVQGPMETPGAVHVPPRPMETTGAIHVPPRPMEPSQEQMARDAAAAAVPTPRFPSTTTTTEPSMDEEVGQNGHHPVDERAAGSLPTMRHVAQQQQQQQQQQPPMPPMEPTDTVIAVATPVLQEQEKHNDDDDDDEAKGARPKTFCIMVLVLLVAVGGGATAAGVLLSTGSGGGGGGGGNNGSTQGPPGLLDPTPSPLAEALPCPVCFGSNSSTAFDATFNRQTFRFQNRDYSCGSFAEETLAIDVEDPLCPVHQAIAWKHCGCTDLPAASSGTIPNACPICLDNVAPLAPNSDCAQEMEFASLLGSALHQECPAQVSQSDSSCLCPLCTGARCLELQSVLVQAVDDPVVFTDASTPQYKALNWLAVEDPGDPAVVRPTDRALRERFVIAVLYFATAGMGWVSDLRFLSGLHVCDWRHSTSDAGISCTSSDAVEEISLSNENLSGRIPVELRYLSSLRSLTLSFNSLVGSIPSELGSVASLEIFDVRTNRLTGQLPESIFFPPGMSILDVRENEIEGTLPSSLSSATSLKQLLLADNLMEGTLPEFIGQSTTLEVLYTWSNSFRGSLPEFNTLSRLWFLSSGANQLTGTIPASLTALSRLQLLALGGNSMSGPIPPFSGRFGSLRTLDISEGTLTGNIGEILGTLSPSQLELLDLGTTSITGTLPSTIGDFSALTSLWVHKTDIEGTIPSELGRLTDLSNAINLGDCRLVGTLPTEIGKLSSARILFMDHNGIHGTIPSEIGGLNSITVFEAGLNSLSGTIPTEIGNCRRLEGFGIFGNSRINGSLADLIDVLPTTTARVYIGELALTGSIPSTIGRLSRLTLLQARRNSLTGRLPSEFGNLRNMELISLRDNRIIGTIPRHFGLMTKLTELELSSNLLNGTLPQDLSMLSLLDGLDLSGNDLTGSPGFLAGLQSLTSLYLHDNQFRSVDGLCDRSWVNLAVNNCDTEVFTCGCCTHCCRTPGSSSCNRL